MKDKIIKSFRLDDKEIINIYPYGSRVYGTHSESSDYDFIIVMDKDVKEFSLTSNDKSINIHLYSIDNFLGQLFQHKVSALECIFLPENLILKNRLKVNFSLDKKKLRSSINEKTSSDLIKAKKRLESEELGDDKKTSVFYGKKSLFHAIRTIDFGSQIIKHGKIIDYSSCNDIWFDIITDPKEDWDHFNNKFKDLLI